MRIKMKVENRHKLNSVSTKTYPKDWSGSIDDELAIEWIGKGLAEPVIDEASVLANITKAVQAEAERIETEANAPGTDAGGQSGTGVDGGGDPSTDTADSSPSGAPSTDDGSGGDTSGPAAEAPGSSQADGQSAANSQADPGATFAEPQNSSQEGKPSTTGDQATEQSGIAAKPQADSAPSSSRSARSRSRRS